MAKSRNLEASEILQEWLNLGEKFENPPEVKLELQSQGLKEEKISQRDIAITTAIQCYSPGKAIMKSRTNEKELAIGLSTLESGHLTTRQHAHYTWRLSGVTRETIHTLLHSFPHYNTDQQSQRYVEAKGASLLLPNNLSNAQIKIYRHAAAYAFSAYEEFLHSLRDDLRNRILASVPKAWQRDDDKINTQVKKHAQEIARYFLPLGQTSTFYYTLDVMTLMRLFASGSGPHLGDEARYLLASMVKSAGDQDATLIEDMVLPGNFEKHNYSFEENRRRNSEFDGHLREWSNSRLLTEEQEIVRMLNQSLGYWQESDQAIEARGNLLAPRNRVNLADNLRPDWHDPVGSKMNEVNIRFMVKLSHSADSQRQRHRTTNSAVCPIEGQYGGEADYTIPRVVRENSLLAERYKEIMETQYQLVNQMLEMGTPRQNALLMLPNAQNIRLIENGSLLGIHHRSAQRLCYLAQEEISQIVWEQAIQLNKVMGNEVFHAPCKIRKDAGVSPYCPEGARFCGIQVWRQSLEDDYWNQRKY